MLRLALASLRHDRRALVAPLVILTVAALLLSLAFHGLWSALTPEGARVIASAPTGTPGALLSTAIFVIVIGLGPPVTICTSIVSSLAVRESEPVYASWRLAGASPRQVRTVTRVRILLGSLLASALGILLSLPLLQPALALLLSSTTIRVVLPVHVGLVPGVAVCGFLLLTTWLASIRPARRASRVRPIVLFAERADPPRHVALRGVLAFVCIAVAVALGVVAQGGGTPSSIAMLAMLAGFTIVLSFSLGAPALVSPLVRLWTAAPGLSRLPSWYLARHHTLARLSATTATVVPLTLAASVLGVYFSVLASWEAVQGRALTGAATNNLQGLIVFGPGAILALIAATGNLFTVGRSRERYEATLRVAGATRATARQAGTVEAVIYAVTALVVASVISALASGLIALAGARAGLGFHLAIAPLPILATVVLGFLPLWASIQLPAASARRRPLAEALSAT